MYFKNLELIESTLNVASFKDGGVDGNWFVSQEDFYSSNSKFKDIFMLTPEQSDDYTISTVTYKVKDYDMLGPADFHEDRNLDEGRDNWDRPWFSIDI